MPDEEQRPSIPEQRAVGGDTMAVDDGYVFTCELACIEHGWMEACVCMCACVCVCMYVFVCVIFCVCV